MKKRLAAAALLLSVALIFSGCFPTGEKDPNTSGVLTDSDFFEYEKENLIVNFKIPDEPNNVPIRIKLKEKFFDTDEMLELFFGSKTIDEEESFPGYYWATDKSFLNVTANENRLKYSDGSTCYDGLGIKSDSPINYRLTLEYSKEHYREMYDIGEELDGFSSEIALSRALELCSTLGITHLDKPDIYAFDLDTYKKIRAEDDSSWFSNEFPLTKDNEVYILSFRQTFNGIGLANFQSVQINDSTVKTGKKDIISPKVTVGVSKGDIFWFDVESIYEAEFEVASSDPIKYDFNFALSELKNYLESFYFNEKTEITDVRIVYFPRERKEQGYVEFALAWSFDGSVQDRHFENSIKSSNIVFLTENGVRINCNYI